MCWEQTGAKAGETEKKQGNLLRSKANLHADNSGLTYRTDQRHIEH